MPGEEHDRVVSDRTVGTPADDPFPVDIPADGETGYGTRVDRPV